MNNRNDRPINLVKPNLIPSNTDQDLENTQRSDKEESDKKNVNSNVANNPNTIYKQTISTLKKEIEKAGFGDKDLPSIKMWKNSLFFIDNSDINKAYKTILESGINTQNIFIILIFR